MVSSYTLEPITAARSAAASGKWALAPGPSSGDGVVSFRIPGCSGGGEISGGSAEDRFVMGLLRSVSDAVLVGSGTLHGDPGHVRIPAFIYPEAKELYAELRQKLGKPPLPLNVVLTVSGKIDLGEPTFHTDGLRTAIVTTNEGASRIA